MSRHTEALIQFEIVKYARSLGVLIFSVANEAAGSNVVRQGQMISMGLLTGVSDLIMVLDGKVRFIEVKAPGEKQKPNQVRFQEKVEKLGHCYNVVFSLDDFKELLYTDLNSPL